MNAVAHSGIEPLAQNYTIAAQAREDGDDRYWFFINIGFAVLADDTFLAAGSHVVTGKDVVAADGTSDCCVVIARSVDRGRTWEDAARIPFPNRQEVTLFAQGNTVFLIVGLQHQGMIMASASDDRGSTWSKPVAIVRLPEGMWSNGGGAPAGSPRQQPWFGCNQTAMVEKDGRLYMTAGACCKIKETMSVAVCDLSVGILNPQAWRISDQVEVPVPIEINPGLYSDPSRVRRCMEGNVIRTLDRSSADTTRREHLRVLARCVIDHYGMANMAAVFDVEEDGDKPRLKFTQLYPIPGGQGKFFIIYDESSKLYWMASNLPANTQDWVPAPNNMRGNDRRFLMLWYACDALNWFPAGCIARTEHLSESFMYPVMMVDGDDLAILARTTKDYQSGRLAAARALNGNHDANQMTFHRVRNFRALAMNIMPQK